MTITDRTDTVRAVAEWALQCGWLLVKEYDFADNMGRLNTWLTPSGQIRRITSDSQGNITRVE